MNQLRRYIYTLPFGFPSHLSHHRALSRVPWALSRLSLVPYFIHSIIVHMCQFQAHSSSHPLAVPPWCPYVSSLRVCLCFHFANKTLGGEGWEAFSRSDTLTGSGCVWSPGPASPWLAFLRSRPHTWRGEKIGPHLSWAQTWLWETWGERCRQRWFSIWDCEQKRVPQGQRSAFRQAQVCCLA